MCLSETNRFRTSIYAKPFYHIDTKFCACIYQCILLGTGHRVTSTLANRNRKARKTSLTPISFLLKFLCCQYVASNFDEKTLTCGPWNRLLTLFEAVKRVREGSLARQRRKAAGMREFGSVDNLLTEVRQSPQEQI